MPSVLEFRDRISKVVLQSLQFDLQLRAPLPLYSLTGPELKYPQIDAVHRVPRWTTTRVGWIPVVQFLQAGGCGERLHPIAVPVTRLLPPIYLRIELSPTTLASDPQECNLPCVCVGTGGGMKLTPSWNTVSIPPQGSLGDSREDVIVIRYHCTSILHHELVRLHSLESHQVHLKNRHPFH